jgi:D-cysteine desulfhydrase family pyridoxal phosphate-dependent enzyme
MKSLNRVPIAHLPTSVENLPQLTKHLNGPKLMVKRDDQTGLAFGGNKTRKLEYLVAEAQSIGAKTLITGGAVQSNHCRQTAAAAARFGFNCILVLAGAPPDNPSGNYLLDKILGVEIIWADRHNRDEVLQKTYKEAEVAGKQPYLVPYGGSNPIGASGYAFAVQELLEQNQKPDWIIFPSSSGGTQAGLVAGARIFGYSGKILGISIDEPEDALKEHVADLASRVMALLGEEGKFNPNEILVNAEFCDAGYGIVTENEIEAIRLFALQEGLLLDPVYTGRAAGGLINLIKKGFFSKEDTVLFWHTGGTPALFANKYLEIFN